MKSTALAAMLFLMGCTDATPVVSILKSINGLEFKESQVLTASLSSVPLEAQCSPFVESVEVSFDDGTTWLAPSSHDANATSNCQNGEFKMNISSSASPLSSMNLASGAILKLKFRAKLRSGGTSESLVRLKYVPSVTISQEMLAGAVTQSGGGVVLRGRVRHQKQQVSSNGAFVIRGRILQ